MRKADKIRKILSAFLEFLFPGNCVICGGPLKSAAFPHYLVCQTCLDGFPKLNGALCNTCGRPIISEKQVCTSCRSRKFNFNRQSSLFEYREGVREMLFHLKFRKRNGIAMTIAGLMACEIRRLYTGLPIVPVPARKKGWLEEKANHVENICRYLSRHHGLKIYACLNRSRGVPQKSLKYEDRLENLRDQINLEKKTLPPGQKVVLVDDIFTTGATADECSRRLKEGGIEQVYVVTFAMDLP